MYSDSFGRFTVFIALFATVVVLSCSHPAEHVRANSVDVGNVSLYDPLLEYHFHTYFNVNDPVEVNHAIELRNEIIANCVDKKIIAIPWRYHYDPENPVKERMFILLTIKRVNCYLIIFDFCFFFRQ